MVLEKGRGDRLNRSCEKWEYCTKSRGGTNCIGRILRRNCLLNHVIEGKIEEKIEVTGRRGRGSNELLGNEKVMATERGSSSLPFTDN